MRRCRRRPTAKARFSTICAGVSTTSRPSGCCPGQGSSISTIPWPRSTRVPSKGYTAAQITDLAMRGEDPVCVEATAMFCAMLGTVAGNLALTLGARGGVFIAGGIVPRLGRYFADSPFRARFEAKGPVRALSRRDPDLCRDPSAGGVSRLRRTAGELTRQRLMHGLARCIAPPCRGSEPDAARAAGNAAAAAARPGSPAAGRGAAEPGAGAAERTAAAPGRRSAATVGGAQHWGARRLGHEPRPARFSRPPR